MTKFFKKINMKVIGKIKKIENIVKEGKIVVVKILLKTNTPDYPEMLPMELSATRIDLLKDIRAEDEVVAFFGLKCRTHKEKTFLSINLTKIVKNNSNLN